MVSYPSHLKSVLSATVTVETGTTRPPDDRLGDTIAARYEIESLIGRGGMSTVYAARDLQLGRRVALKLFRAELAAGDDMRRHRDEIEVLASLNHPALVTLYDAVDDDTGAAVLVLELVDGHELGEVIAEGPLPAAEAALIGAAIADALSYTHARGIMHRDVKPGNIIVPHNREGDTGPRAKLVDFGIARLVDESRLTGTGSVLGTAHYLSPEQALGSGVGTPSDIYSLGLVLLEALTGRRAFEGTGIAAAAARLSRDPEIPDDMASGWSALLTTMTARVAEDRPTAAEVATHLRKLAIAGPHTDGDAPAGDHTATEVLSAAHVITVTGATEVLPAATTAQKDETASRTRVLPASAIPAGRFGAASPSTSAPETSSARSRRLAAAAARKPRQPLPRRLAVLAGAVVGAILLFMIGFLVTSAVSQWIADAAPAEPPAAPSYESVPGELGEHLERLQRSVEP